MHKKLLLLPFIYSIATAKIVEPKVMHAIDTPVPQSRYETSYQNSSNMESTDDKVISSTAEASAQITVVTSVQVTTELSAGGHGGGATMSFLDNNRIQITEDIAKGKGEHIETLLCMMKLKKDKQSLAKIQLHLEEFIYLGSYDFLNKLESIV